MKPNQYVPTTYTALPYIPLLTARLQVGQTMRGVLDRLQALSPVIAKICSISGTPVPPLGALHQGNFIYIQDFYNRDVGAKLSPERYTIYYIASLRISVTTADVGVIVIAIGLDDEPGFGATSTQRQDLRYPKQIWYTLPCEGSNSTL